MNDVAESFIDFDAYAPDPPPRLEYARLVLTVVIEIHAAGSTDDRLQSDPRTRLMHVAEDPLRD